MSTNFLISFQMEQEQCWGWGNLFLQRPAAQISARPSVRSGCRAEAAGPRAAAHGARSARRALSTFAPFLLLLRLLLSLITSANICAPDVPSERVLNASRMSDPMPPPSALISAASPSSLLSTFTVTSLLHWLYKNQWNINNWSKFKDIVP